MAIVRWNPWGELFAVQGQVDHLFNGMVAPTPSTGTASLALDIRQGDDAYTIEASVPGFTPEEVEVTLDENVLTIRGQHRQDSDGSKGGYVRRERRVSSFSRRVTLPAEVDAAGITAGYENGVLTVRVPRTERAQPRRIPVAGTSVVEAEAGSISDR